MEAAFGTETKIDVKKSEICSECKGNGCKSGYQPEACGHCNGTGQITRSQGFFTVRTTCPSCRGTGQVITHPCKECKGQGQVQAEKKVSVKIPAGVDSGSRLRLTGEGEAGLHGGLPGDLYVFIYVEGHDFFKRDDTNVYCEIPITFIQAALGDNIMVPTLNGEKSLVIPKGTQPGDFFRFRGEGIPSLRTSRKGDLVVRVNIKTPTNLNKKQEKLLKEFAQIEKSKLTRKLKNILTGNYASAT
jgi:molecular chaperone DnaJ